MFKVIPTEKNIEISIPKAFIPEFTDILNETQIRLSKIIANKYNLNPTEILDTCKPNNIIISSNQKNSTPIKNIDINNYYEATEIGQLNKLLVKDLKIILSELKLSTTGKKEILINTLWEYISNNKKEYNKIKYNTVSIYIDDNNNVCNKDSINSSEYFIIPEKNWVFKKEQVLKLKYIGVLNDNKLINSLPSNELLEYASNI